MCYGDNMKKLEIAFTDTSEKVVIDETALIIAIRNKTTPVATQPIVEFINIGFIFNNKHCYG